MLIKSLPSLLKARKRVSYLTLDHVSYQFDSSYDQLGKNLTYHIRTYGCQSNVVDTQIMSGMLERAGYQWVENVYEADLVILNTCAIRENAEKKVFGEIGLLAKIRRRNPKFMLGLCGCMSQEESVVDDILKKNRHVDFIIGTHNLDELISVIALAKKTKQKVVQVYDKPVSLVEQFPMIRDSKIKAFVNIQYGCDNFCTYCIVPYTRGQMRSRKKEEILKEVNELVNKGYKEITLLGQNVNAYGIDFQDQNYRFVNLLEDVAKTKIARLRFTTSNPWNFDTKIVDLMAQYKNIMPYLHLPVQSGNNQILEKMNRKMDIQEYINKINYIKKVLPQCAISTDLIVGFPNETHEQFLDTLKLYEIVQYDNAYTFVYSPRKGTYAATIKDEISLEEKKNRLYELNLLVKKYARANNQKWVNQVVDVLVESVSKKDHNKLTGYSEQWKVVNFNGQAQVGEIVKVRIIRALGFSLIGEQVYENK